MASKYFLLVAVEIEFVVPTSIAKGKFDIQLTHLMHCSLLVDDNINFRWCDAQQTSSKTHATSGTRSVPRLVNVNVDILTST